MNGKASFQTEGEERRETVEIWLQIQGHRWDTEKKVVLWYPIFSENNRRTNIQFHKLLKIHFIWTLSDSKEHELCFHSRSRVVSKWKGETIKFRLGWCRNFLPIPLHHNHSKMTHFSKLSSSSSSQTKGTIYVASPLLGQMRYGL